MDKPTNEQKVRAVMGLEPAETVDDDTTQDEQDPEDARMRRIMGLPPREDSDR